MREERKVESGAGDDTPIILETLRGIRSGTLDPRSLDRPTRRLCVEFLFTQGKSVPEVASILKRSERTIFRDLDAIREANAIECDPRLVETFVGELVGEARRVVSELTKMSNNPAVQDGVRELAIRDRFHVLDRLGARLQRLGYLPEASHRIEARITDEEGPAREALAEMIASLTRSLDDPGLDHETRRQARAAITRARRQLAAAEMEEASDSIGEQEGDER